MARNYDAEKQKIIDDLLAKGVNKYEAEQISQNQIDQMKLGSTAFEKITDDEASRSAQNESMSRYQEMAENGGFTAADRAAQNQSSQRGGQQDNARRLAILSEMQQRGKAGSGSELAARLAGADASARQQADDSQQIAARGEARRDGAIAARANLGSQMRDQDYRTQSNLANARDSVTRFNADVAGRATFQNNQNENQSRQYNTGSQNQFDQNAGQLRYNSVVESEQAALQREADRKKKKSGMMGAVLGAAGAGAGAYFGGPAGAGAGYAVGSGLGQAFAHGGKVKGPEIVEGDDEENDVIPAMLSAHEIVIPKSHAKDPQKAAAFVAKVNDEDCETEHEEEPSIEETVMIIAKALAKLKGR